MIHRFLVGAALAGVLMFAGPGRLAAHEGHSHKVLGTVSSVQGNHVEVKTTDGKRVVVMLDAKTKITRGKEKLDLSAIKVGGRVSIDAMQEKDMMMAQAVKLGVAAAASK
ncbi:MAG: hypothetical protein ABI868_02835 [Acidobacteriota bacterium]